MPPALRNTRPIETSVAASLFDVLTGMHVAAEEPPTQPGPRSPRRTTGRTSMGRGATACPRTPAC